MEPNLAISDLTLVIPAFNEEQRLPQTLAEAKSYLDAWGIKYRVLVVDDGSVDNTAAVASQFGERFTTIRQVNGGKGLAVRTGILAAQSRVVAFTDADLPYDLENLRTAYNLIAIDSYDVVFGSRVATGTKCHVRRRWTRTAASAVFRALMMMLVSREVSDTQCGLKAFSQSAARTIFSRTRINGFAFDAEVVYLTHRFKLPFKVIPVTLINEYSSTISLTRHAAGMLLDVLRVRWSSMLGGYPRTSEDIESEYVVESCVQIKN